MRNNRISRSQLFFSLLFCSFLLVTFILPNSYAQLCSEFNSGSSQSALNIALDKDKYFELTYKDIARTKRDDFTISFTPAVKKTLRDASKSSNQILSIIIKYDKSEPGRPPMVPLIRFFVQGTLGTTNLKAESSNVDDCKEVHNFNISVQEAKELFQNNRLDFDLLINVLNQGPANRIGQKFRITICLNCTSSSESSSATGATGTGSTELPPEGPPLEDTLPEDSTTWIIIDGPGIGVQIHSEPGLPTSIEPDFNKTTSADGSIANPDRCEGPFKHYHGELDGGPDPNPTECGWGHVIEFTKATEFTQFASAVISLEDRASLKIVNLDIDGAIKDLEDAISQMEELINRIKKRAKGNKILTRYEAPPIVKGLRGAIRLDKAVLKKLNTLKEKLPKNEKIEDPELEKTINEIVDEIAKLVKKAFDLKQDMFKRIAEEEFLAPHP